ncbi:MAG: hypothetical protein Q9217_005628 [Psora testacea]
MLATESARNPLARSPIASYQPRGLMNESSSSFGSSSVTSQSNRLTSSSATSNYSSGEQQGLFPPPIPQIFSPHPMDVPQPTQNIMNRRAGTDSSLYQICINLKKRLADVPGFHEHIAEMDEEEALEGDFIDPVTSMWNCLRRGFPLMTVYNALRPKQPLEVDPSRYGESKIGKAATFQFLQACLGELKFPSNEVFLITDLYGEDTTGFVKVTKCVNKVLDVLQKRGLLLQRAQSAADVDYNQPQTLTHRQKIVEEFVKTERDYVQHLETLQQFKNEVEESGAIAGDAAHDIFLNLNALLDFQRRFLIRIEQQNSLAESQQDWGKLLHYYKESFRVYEPFIANQNRCRETVEKQWDKLRQAPLPPELKDLVDTPATLLGFLLKPFQRLTKYPMLLKELRDKGGLDEARRRNLDDGIAAAESILHSANDAIHKEQRLSAVVDLQQRVEDWKGHKIDHFGELLLHGSYTVLKGEGAREVEREVSMIFDSLDPKTRSLLLRTISSPQHEHRPTPTPSTPKRLLTPKSPTLPCCRTPKKYASELADVPEHPTEGTLPLTLRDALAKRFRLRRTTSRQDMRVRDSPRTQSVSPPKRCKTSRHGVHSEPPSPTRSGSRETPKPVSDLKANLALIWSPKMSKSPRTVSGPNAPQVTPKIDEGEFKVALKFCQRLSNFNSVFTFETAFLNAPMASVYCSAFIPISATQASKRGPIERPKPNHLERLEADDKALRSPQREQYKVYLFERILLCCKEINPNKPKNKMLGNNKPLVDKKGQPKLQLKGRIFMQNVTDVLTFKRIERSSYTVQIFWKGDPGVENFVIRFGDEKTMTEWQETVQRQKKNLGDSARKSGQNSTSSTEYLYLKNQPRPQNPYREPEDVEDEDEHSSQVHTATGNSRFSESRNASNTSLRSMGAQPGGNRGQHPRYAPPDRSDGQYGSALSLNTNVALGAHSPGESAGHSYFSPSNDSPTSLRSTSQASMYGFPRQQAPPTGWSYENGKHRTAPAMPRAPSREGPPPSTRPSLPTMPTSQHPQSQLQPRLRSASTPDINGPRRPPNGQLQSPPDNIPVPPIPNNMRIPNNRSRTASPFDPQFHARGATNTAGDVGSKMPLLNPIIPNLTAPSDRDAMYPTQLKVKILFDPAPSHVTIVVPITIKYRTLIDRIDSKMVRVSSASIARGSARLRYKDRDDDLIVIKTDEDVGDAIEEWGAVHEHRLRQGIIDDFELFWQEKPERA